MVALALIGCVLACTFGWAWWRARREAEALRRGEAALLRHATLGRASAGFAHDLRNSLMVLQGFADLAKRASAAEGTEPRLRELVETVGTQARRATSELQRWLELASGGSVDDAKVPIGDVLLAATELVKPIARERDFTLELDAPALAQPLVADVAVRAALLNLLLNAVDHARGAIRVEGTEDGGTVRIVIVDDGPGVDPAVAARLFEPYAAGPGGLGLGLANAREALQREGGSLVYERRDGRTRFVASLPLGRV